MLTCRPLIRRSMDGFRHALPGCLRKTHEGCSCASCLGPDHAGRDAGQSFLLGQQRARPLATCAFLGVGAGRPYGGTPVAFATAFAISDSAFVGTGYGPTSEFWASDPVTATWTRKAGFPGRARDPAAAGCCRGDMLRGKRGGLRVHGRARAVTRPRLLEEALRLRPAVGHLDGEGRVPGGGVASTNPVRLAVLRIRRCNPTSNTQSMVGHRPVAVKVVGVPASSPEEPQRSPSEPRCPVRPADSRSSSVPEVAMTEPADYWLRLDYPEVRQLGASRVRAVLCQSEVRPRTCLIPSTLAAE